MSWFERTQILLRPDEVRVARQPAFGRGAAAVDSIPVVPLPGDGHGIEPWRACTDTVVKALSKAQAHGAVTAVISDHFVRYILIPWNAGLVADNERLAFARLQFHEVYGALADTWEVSMDQQPAGEASFACAIDRGLLQALRDACLQHGARLAAAVPALADRINRHRGALKGTAFCVASIESRRMTLAFHDVHGWQSVRGRRSDGALEDELPMALKQEAAAGNGTAGGVLYLIGEGVGGMPAFSVSGWKVVRLSEVGGPAAAVGVVISGSGAGARRRLTPQGDRGQSAGSGYTAAHPEDEATLHPGTPPQEREEGSGAKAPYAL